MFKQSRAIARRNWQRFLSRNERQRHRFEIIQTTDLPYKVKLIDRNVDDQTVHDLMFELNSLRMHEDLWRAVERDPLSNLYSIAWTLCSSIMPPRELLDDPNAENIPHVEYYANWYPFVLLHRYLIKLRDRSGKYNEPELELFTVEQLLETDRRYLRSFDELKQLRDDPLAARRVYTRQENEFLASDLFQEMAKNTPFGALERIDATQIVYTKNLLDVRRKRRLVNLFKRNVAYESLRSQCESKLRKLFPRYATENAETLRLNCWLLSMLRRDEDTGAFDEDYDEDTETDVATTVDDEKNRLGKEYVVYWQYQKSELVWFLVHALFALNDIVRDDQLTRDLLYYTSNHLGRLVECGVCAEHWKREGKKLWQMYSERYEFVETQWRHRTLSMVEGNTQLDAMIKTLSFARLQPHIDPALMPPDLNMLHTHNSIQGDNVSSRKRLTRTCVESLRLDFTMFALLVEITVTKENREQHQVIRQLSAQRNDILTSDKDIYIGEMLKEYTTNLTNVKMDSIKVLRDCTMTLERRAILNILHGRSI